MGEMHLEYNNTYAHAPKALYANFFTRVKHSYNQGVYSTAKVFL